MSSNVDDVSPTLHSMDEGAVKRRRGVPKSRPVSSPTASDRLDDEPETTHGYEAENEQFRTTALEGAPTASAISPGDSGSLTLNQIGPSVTSPSYTSMPEVASTFDDSGHSLNTFRERREPKNRRLSRLARRPHSLALSESESSVVTQDAVHPPPGDTGPSKARRRGNQRSPSFSTSTISTFLDDAFSDHQAGSDLSWSPGYPEYAVASQPPPQFSPAFDPRFAGPQFYPQQYPPLQYGPPGTPRGPAPFSFYEAPRPPIPMAAAPPAGPPVNPPLVGYQFLAAKVAGDLEGPIVKPIYRRFDATTHRVLLSLQDQIIALEEDLADMDQEEAIRLDGRPESERRERGANDDFHIRKGRAIGMVSQKLQYYNSLITSHKDMQAMATPTPEDIRAYRRFLDDEVPIVEEETRFLDAIDLIVMDNSQTLEQRDPNRPNRPAPAPRPTNEVNRQNNTTEQDAAVNQNQFLHIAVGVFLAIFIPSMAFHFILDTLGRLSFVGLIGFATIFAMSQLDILPEPTLGVAMLSMGLYAAIMAALIWRR